MTKRYRPSNKSGKNSKATSSGFDSNVFNVSNLQSEMVRRVMAHTLGGGAQAQEQDEDSEDNDTTDGYDSHQVSTSAYDDSDEDDSEDGSSDDGIDEAQLLAMLQALQAKKTAKKAEKSRQRKKRYASTTNDEDEFSDIDIDNLSPSEMTEEQYFEYERRLAIKEEKLRAQKARIAESRARAAGSSRNATPSSSSLSLPSTKDKKEPRNYVPYSTRRENSTGSTNISGWETPPGTPPSLLAPAKPPKMPSLGDKPAPRKKKGAEFVTAGVSKSGVGTVDIHHYPSPLYPGAPSSSSKVGASAAGSTASKIERFERKTSASSTSTKESVERRKPSIDRKVPAGAARGGKKRE